MTIRSRRALSAAIPALLAAGLTGLPAAAAQAADSAPSEVAVLPADNEPTLSTTSGDWVIGATATGFLYRDTSVSTSPEVWASNDGKTTHVLPGTGWTVGGGDDVYTNSANSGYPLTVIPVFDGATGQTHLWNRNGATSIFQADDNHLLTRTTSGGTTIELRTYAADGSYTVTPVTSSSGEQPSIVAAYTSNATSAVVSAQFSTGSQYGLLDLASGHLTEIPASAAFTGARIVMTADRVAVYHSDDTAQVYSIADLAAGTATPLASYPNVLWGSGPVLAGDDVLVSSTTMYAPGDSVGTPVTWKANNVAVQAPDDTAVVANGTGPADWAIRKITATGSTVLLALNHQKMVVGGLTVSNGMLRREEVVPQPGITATRYVTASSTTTANATPTLALHGTEGPPDTCGPTCLHTVADESQGQFLTQAQVQGAAVESTTGGTESNPIFPVTAGTVVDAGANWVVVEGTTAAGTQQQYFDELGTSIALTRAPAAEAISFNKLWTASATTPGTLQSQALTETIGAVDGTVSTGANCTPTELQATNLYIYWSCGASGPAGVYDLTAKTDVTVPAATYLLGDGYLVHHAADGNLIRNTITGGTFGADAVLGNFPVATGDERNQTWAVDKFGGDVAYVDSSEDTYVVDPGVPPSPVTAGYSDNSGSLVYPTSLQFPWTAITYLTRPVKSWQLVLTEVSNSSVHPVVASGGAASGPLQIRWNGLVNGKQLVSGDYRYQLNVSVDGVTSTIASGTLPVACGIQAFRSFQCSGSPSFFAVTTGAQGYWMQTNTASTSIYQDNTNGVWPLGSTTGHYNAIVPFGDANGDGLNDLVTRSGTGTLEVLLNSPSYSDFDGGTQINLGSNWNIYNALASIGDVNGDGKADLLAREADNGTLWIYPGLGNGHFGSRYALTGSYKGYNRIVGVGDITGDGKPDLLLTGPTGTMYEMRGNGTGGFGPVVTMGSGYTAYNAIIGIGDLNEDGHNDLLVRDASGNFYRMLGSGNGSFAAAQKIATGYQKYAGLY